MYQILLLRPKENFSQKTLASVLKSKEKPNKRSLALEEGISASDQDKVARTGFIVPLSPKIYAVVVSR